MPKEKYEKKGNPHPKEEEEETEETAKPKGKPKTSQRFLDPKTRPYGEGKYDKVIQAAMKFLSTHGPGSVTIPVEGPKK